MKKEGLYKQQLVELGMLRDEEKQTFERKLETQVYRVFFYRSCCKIFVSSPYVPCNGQFLMMVGFNVQATKSQTEMEQERLGWQRQNSKQMEEILDKVCRF